MRLPKADVRRDYAVFTDDRFVTNAMLTEGEAAEMELEGVRCLLVTDQPGETLPAFRGRCFVRRKGPSRGRWGGG